jgi:hypothetical protein
MWRTEFGEMRLTQSGDTVSASYDWDQGQTVDATVGAT